MDDIVFEGVSNVKEFAELLERPCARKYKMVVPTPDCSIVCLVYIIQPN